MDLLWIYCAKQVKERVDNYRYTHLKKRVVILIGWLKVLRSPKKIQAFCGPTFAVCMLV